MTTRPPDANAAIDWLYSSQLFGIKLGLEGMTRLLDELGLTAWLQEERAAGRLQLVHLAGTNGKGSTGAFLEALARAAGKTTGFFTSPHLITLGERARVQGEIATDEACAQQLEHIRACVTSWENAPTFFELVTAMALLHFRACGCNFLIMETGMGGRLDATNALDKDLAIITPIAMDHAAYLGDTLAAIAGEKAGIIAQDTPVLSAMQEEESAYVLRAHASACKAPLEWAIAPLPTDIPLSLKGAHQRENAALALAAARKLLPHNEIHLGALARCCWPGRYDQRGGYLLDGAHNPHAMAALVATLRADGYSETRPLPCLFAGAADKELGENIRLLAPVISCWHLPVGSSPRLTAPTELRPLIEAQSHAPIHCWSDVPSALHAIQMKSGDTTCLVTGSLFLLGDVLHHMEASEQEQRPTLQ